MTQCCAVLLSLLLLSEKEVELWLVTQLRTLSGWTPLEGDEETVQVQQSVLSSKMHLHFGFRWKLKKN